MICLCITAPTIVEDIELIRRYVSCIDCIELRVDCLEPSERSQVHRFPGLKELQDKKTICTVRRLEDGGRSESSETNRLRTLREAAESGFDFIDVEEDVSTDWCASVLRRSRVRIIRSQHDFEGIPADIDGTLTRLSADGAYIPKLAVTPKSVTETFDLFEAAARYRGERILVGMGDWGFPTRILSSRMGNILTFTSAAQDPTGRVVSAAPGHIDPETLSQVYGFENLSSSTVTFAVIGNPVMHSRSPWIHNPGFRRLGINAVYIPIQVKEVATFLKRAVEFGIHGISVTVPHKRAVIEECVALDDAVQEVGACNTLVYESDGWHGYNTDVDGFIAPLISMVGVGWLRDRSAIVLGAGGAAVSAVYALKREGANVTVLNRTVSRAESLAEKFDCAWGGLADITRYDTPDLVVNTSVAGMHPLENVDPISEYRFRGTEVVYDLIYNPVETLLLKRAREAGCTVLNGADMLLEQGYVQFRLFTGREFPLKGERLW